MCFIIVKSSANTRWALGITNTEKKPTKTYTPKMKPCKVNTYFCFFLWDFCYAVNYMLFGADWSQQKTGRFHCAAMHSKRIRSRKSQMYKEFLGNTNFALGWQSRQVFT